jgi:hypothetical protein
MLSGMSSRVSIWERSAWSFSPCSGRLLEKNCKIKVGKGAPNALPREIERTEQRWFIGAHANVGGGCFDDPLAESPCKWLLRQTSN